MRPELEEIKDREVTVRKYREENRLPFSDVIPDFVSERFSYRPNPSSYDKSAVSLLSGRKIVIDERETVLRDHDTPVVTFSTNDYIGSDGNFYSMYGEVDTGASDWINFAVMVEGEDNVQEAREKFRENALITERLEDVADEALE